MEWLRKLSDAIAYIEQNLDAEISYEEAAVSHAAHPIIFKECFPMSPAYRCQIISEDEECRRLPSICSAVMPGCWMLPSSMAIPHQPHLTEPFKRFTVSLRQPQKISAKHCMHIRRYSFLSISQEEVLWPII